jgi:hypothetical protein
VNSEALCKDEKYNISGSGDKSIKICERETGSEFQTLQGHLKMF